MSISSRVFGLRALARADLNALDKSRQFPSEFRHVNFDGMTEDEACITMESLASLRKVDKSTSKVFFDYLWDDSKRLSRLSLQNKLRVCAGLKDFRTQHPKHNHIIKKLFALLNDSAALAERKLLVDALLHCGQLSPLTLREKHRVIRLVTEALEDGVTEPMWAMPRAMDALKIHEEKIFVAFADRMRVDELSYKEMLEFVRGLTRWEVGPPGMRRCALTVFTDLHPPTSRTTFLWVRALSRLKLDHIQQHFIDALMDLVPQVARRLNAENLLLFANALSYNFPYSPQFAQLAEEVEKQLPLEVYNFEDYAALFRVSWYFKSPTLAAELQRRIHSSMPSEPHKAAAKVMHAAAQWSTIDPAYGSLVDTMIPLADPSHRIQVLGAASNPASIVESVTEELCFLSRHDLRACSIAVRDDEVAAKIREDFERRELGADDILYWLRASESVPELMKPLITKYREDRTPLGAACRDALYWDAYAIR